MNDDIPDPDDDDLYRHERTLPILRYGPNGEPPYGEDDPDFADHSDDPIPPFDMFHSVLGPKDHHEAARWMEEPDSSLNGLKPYTTRRQLQELHYMFLDIYDKHHGF